MINADADNDAELEANKIDDVATMLPVPPLQLPRPMTPANVYIPVLSDEGVVEFLLTE